MSNKPPPHRFPLSLRTSHTFTETATKASKHLAQRRSLTSVLYPQTTVHHTQASTARWFRTKGIFGMETRARCRPPVGWGLIFWQLRTCSFSPICVFFLLFIVVFWKLFFEFRQIYVFFIFVVIFSCFFFHFSPLHLPDLTLKH